MKNDCERLKLRALKYGEGSPEHERWVQHCRHCDECRSMWYLTGLLRKDARETREKYGSHLSNEHMVQLMQVAQQQFGDGKYYRRRRWSQAMYWVTRAACIGLLAYAGLTAGSRFQESQKEQAIVAAAPRSDFHGSRDAGRSIVDTPVPEETAWAEWESMEDASFLNGLVFPEDAGTMPEQTALLSPGQPSGERVMERLQNLDEAAAYSVQPEFLSAWRMEDTIQACRKRMMRVRADIGTHGDGIDDPSAGAR